jgi:ribosome biogenesis GTP-binding protein YsxC/EngB
MFLRQSLVQMQLRGLVSGQIPRLVMRRCFSSEPTDPGKKKAIADCLRFIFANDLGRSKPRSTRGRGKHAKFVSLLDTLREQFAEDSTLAKYRPNFTYVGSALEEEHIPGVEDEKMPQIAIAGRSNVGKSSLLKAMAIRGTNLPVVCEDVPGTTQTLDFFEMPGVLRIVDLPGYGFAYAKPEKIEQWQALTTQFLVGASGKAKHKVKRVFVLIDARHAVRKADHELLDMLALHRVGFHIVVTKTDLVPPVELARRVVDLRLFMGAKYGYTMSPQHIHMVSSKTGAGIVSLWQSISQLLPPAPVKLRELERKKRKKVAKQEAKAAQSAAQKSENEKQQPRKHDKPWTAEQRIQHEKRETLMLDKKQRRVGLLAKMKKKNKKKEDNAVQEKCLEREP